MKMWSMSIERRKRRIERRRLLAGEWKPRTAGRSENALFDHCFELAEAARDLERVAGADGSSGATAASLGCATSAFESLANAMLKMRGVVLRELSTTAHADGSEPAEAEQLGRLLYAIDQNLRFAAHAADLGRQAAPDAAAAEPQRA